MQSVRFQFALFLCLLAPIFSVAQKSEGAKPEQNSGGQSHPWTFAVAGDSRNCGDVVMPAIAAEASKEHAAFYWHLGDLRKISAPDQDFMQLAKLRGETPTLDEYRKAAWKDFTDNQIAAFGSILFFVGIGNHETIPPKTRAAFVSTFAQWLDQPELKEQRLKDDPKDTQPKTYFHWIRDGIDFINLDNAVNSEFDPAQLAWFKGVISRDSKDESIRTVVVGMHEALPESISAGHSMNESTAGTKSGEEAYQRLLKLQNEDHKKVYVLASHSHFYMEGIFNTEYWRTHGGVLPGWIIGTAGAERYALPDLAKDAKAAKTNVYGYLLATVPGKGDGSIRFEFKQIDEDQIPPEVAHRFTQAFVHECFIGNRQTERFFH